MARTMPATVSVKLMPKRREQPPHDALAAVHREQRDAGRRVREDDGQVDEALDGALADEVATRQQVRERDADDEGDRRGDQRRRHRQPQRAADVVLAQSLAEEAGAGADDHARRRQHDEGDEQRAGARRRPPRTAMDGGRCIRAAEAGVRGAPDQPGACTP